MKTTVDIPDALLRRVKRLAAQRGTTFKVVLEDALRRELAAQEEKRDAAPIRTHTFGGQGLQAGLTWNDWSTIRSLSYEGRGG